VPVKRILKYVDDTNAQMIKIGLAQSIAQENERHSRAVILLGRRFKRGCFPPNASMHAPGDCDRHVF
jgi:hypothetical protein